MNDATKTRNRDTQSIRRQLRRRAKAVVAATGPIGLEVADPSKYSVRFCWADHGKGFWQRQLTHDEAKISAHSAEAQGFDVEIVSDREC